MVLQFYFVNYVAIVERYIHHLWRILLVRCLEHSGMVARATVCPRDEGSHIGRIGSSIFGPYKETCHVSIGSSEALVQEVYFVQKRRPKGGAISSSREESGSLSRAQYIAQGW
jgi:hypothetical protein